MKSKIIKISEIKFDRELYPRTMVNWQTAIAYQAAMQNGAVFPPIVVAILNNEYILIDGAHRLEAYKRNKETDIKVLVDLTIGTRKQAYLAALKANMQHGKQLTIYERMLAVQKLKEFKVEFTEISKLIHVRPQNLKNFVGKRITYTMGGKEVIVKKPLMHKAGMNMTTEQINAQEGYAQSSQSDLIDELISLLENDLIDENVYPKLQKLAALIAGKIHA